MLTYAQLIRRELHKYPEIGFDLPKTLSLLRSEIEKMGVEYTEEYGKSSIVATLNPEKSHYTIAIRADIDALPITEMNDTEYKSQNEGKMHACGHDAHTAITLATLKELSEIKDSISCRVKVIFQAAEEYAPSGAMLMARDGVMDGVDMIVALHCDSDYPAGHIATMSGYTNATSDGFTLTFKGKSSHAAMQQYGVDAITMAVRAYTDMEFAVVKEVSAREAVVFNVGSIHGGTTNNVICDECSMFCTLRTHYAETADYLLDKFKRIGKAVADTAGGVFVYEHKKHYPAVYNDPDVIKLIRSSASKVVGCNIHDVPRRSMGGEDFSYFLEHKPGAIFRLGVGNEERGITHGLHTARFDIDERALEVGTKIFKQFILDNMK